MSKLIIGITANIGLNKEDCIGTKIIIKSGSIVGSELIGSEISEAMTITEYNKNTGIALMRFPMPKHPVQIEDLIDELDSLKESSMKIIYEL